MLKRFILVSVCILAAAGAHAAGTKAEKSLMPLAVGNRWEYSVSEFGVMSVGDGDKSKSVPTESNGTCIEEITGVKERRSNGDVVYEDKITTSVSKGTNSDAHESVMDNLLLRSKDGIFTVASKSSGMNGLLSDEWVNYNPPLVMYATGLKSGTKWKVGTAREGKLRMPMYAQVAGYETVTVPAGTFEDCAKIHITCSRVAGSMGEGVDQAEIKDGKSVTTVWVYPGVGVVKEDNIIQAKMEFPPDEKGDVLTMTGTQRKIKELQPGYRADSE